MLPFYTMTIDDAEGMDYIALVDHPAHSKTLVAMSKQGAKFRKPKARYAFNDDQQVLTGVAIAVDMPIYRNDDEIGEHFVIFSKKDTRAIARKMMASNYHNNVNEQHDMNKDVKGMVLEQSIFVDSKTGVGTNIFKDQHLKDGSWIVSYYVEDKTLWADIKKKISSGEITGFSIEGWFNRNPLTIKKTSMKKKKKGLRELVFGKAKPYKDEMATATTSDGVEVMWEGDSIDAGTAVFVMDEEGNQIQAPEGQHLLTLENGDEVVIDVDANGVVATVEAAMDADDADEEAMAEVMSEMRKEYEDKFEAQQKEIDELKADNKTINDQLSKLVDALDGDEDEPSKKFNRATGKSGGKKTSKSWQDLQN